MLKIYVLNIIINVLSVLEKRILKKKIIIKKMNKFLKLIGRKRSHVRTLKECRDLIELEEQKKEWFEIYELLKSKKMK